MPKFKKIIILFLGILLFAPNLARADETAGSTASVTVPAHISDYQLSLARTTPGTSFSKGDEITYQLTYGAYLSYATLVKVEAQWYPGTLTSDGSSVDILDYVPDSATNGYAATTPVVDIINHKISWTFNSFPGNTTNQVVNFKLKLNSNYTGSGNVNFNVAGRLSAPAVKFPDQTNSAILKGTQTNNPGPTATPIPSVTPTPGPSLPNVKGVEIRTVTNNSVSIYITTDQNSKIGLSYGTSLNQLTQVQKNSAYSKSALINLSGLSPSANYYFKFSATNQNGNQIISDVYSFTTAKAPPSATIDTTSLVVTSNDSILSSGDNSQQSASGSGAQSQQSPIIVIPESTVFQVKFVLKNTSNVKKVQAIVRLNQAATQISRNESKNSKVLGAQLIPEADASTAIVDLVESEPGIYTGKLKTTNLIGDYEIIAKIYDTKGNITEQKIGNLKVIHKFSVFSKKDNKPIEGVRVYLYVYSSGKYIPIPSSSISSGNPVFTDLNGRLVLVLPQGKYRALVTNIQYKDQFVNFTLGASGDQDFPAVYLEPEKLSLLKLIRYYSRTTNDVFLYYTIAYAQALTGSSRFFDLVSAMTLCALALLTLFAFSKRHHVPLSSMISYFYYLIDHKKSEKYIHGVVYDEKNKPIPSANVYIADSSDEQIVEKVRTNSRGEFFSRKGGKEYSILIMAKGYKSTPLLQYKDREGLKFKVILEKEHEGLNLTENIAHLINSMIGMSFEALEIITIIFELLFINSFGLIKTLPFLVISIFNLLLWVLYLRHHHEIEY